MRCGGAIVVATDVAAVAELARQADEVYGGIDVWINNAGTGVFGPYYKAEVVFHRRTIDPLEFCETAKATAWEITSRRADAAFFAAHPLSELAAWPY